MKALKISKTTILIAMGIAATGVELTKWPTLSREARLQPAEAQAFLPGDIRTAIMETCGGCHANATFSTAGDFNMSTGAGIHAGGVFAQQQGVDPTTMVNGDPLTALIVQKPLEESSMAHGGIKIPQSHPALQEIINWVANGAPSAAVDAPVQPPVQYVNAAGNQHHIIYVKSKNRPGNFRSIIGGIGSNPDGDLWRAKFQWNSGTQQNEIIENVNLTNLPDGDSVNDPSLSLDGTKVVFARRQGGQPWQIWEIGTDGSGLRQITSGSSHKAQPVYLPYLPDGTPARSGEGGILYTSPEPNFRDEYNTGPTTSLFVSDANGGNKRQIGFTPSHELHPTLHSSGAMLFTRWEHNEHQGHNFMPVFSILASDYQSAGTNLFGAYGEHHIAPIPMANSLHYPKEIFTPGSNGRMLAVAGSRDIVGGSIVGPFFPKLEGSVGNSPITNVVALGDFDEGMDMNDMIVNPSSVTWIDPNGLLAPDSEPQLIAGKATLDDVIITLLFNGTSEYTYVFGNYKLVTLKMLPSSSGSSGLASDITLDTYYDLELGPTEEYHYYNAIPLISRPTPDKLGKPVDPTKNTGTFTSGNVTDRQGDGQPSNFQVDDVSVVRFIQGTGLLADVDTGLIRERGIATQILGEAPVFSDGSFAAEVPAEVPMQFQLIDRDGRVLVSHKPWVQVQKGETMRCVGCHANHSAPAEIQTLEARQAPPTAMGIGGLQQFSYQTHIQPIWDNNCVSCHDSARVHGAEAGLSLSGRLTPGRVSESYEHLAGMRMMMMGNWQPLVRTQKSRESRLMHVLTHTNLYNNTPLDPPLSVPHNEILTAEQLETITRWIDTGRQFNNSGALTSSLTQLDLDKFTNQVWPHMAAMCLTCHTAGGAGEMAMNLDGDPEGSDSEEEVFENRMMEVAFRSNWMIPEASEILRKPLGEALGGIPHGGSQVYSGLTDPGYLALYNWISSHNPALAPGGPSTDLVNVSNYPNPFRDVTTIVYGLVGTVVSSVEIKLYSQTGKMIRELAATSTTGGMSVGWNRVDWDGKDKNGKEVGNDVYFYTVKAKFGDGTEKKVTSKCVKVK